ncbi:hypothetical protein BDM02DRAFT_2243567 [Thelephora ganbajun]|uniref:Uncharacterized protein n=1 Tax=Thelephora ganbajun TaxID=370292 RepID=A0ACB6ZG49_THEGA|nr:hypothetical protein BDM02DRAFT_2243567 [Thelephora ganbajun]
MLERGGPVSDRWTTAPGRATSWHSSSSSDQNLSMGDGSPMRQISLSSGHQDHRSFDTVDQLRRSESQMRSRGRSSSRRSIQVQPPDLVDPTPSPESLENRTRSPGATSQESRDGQATQPPFEQRNRSSGHAKASLRPSSRSFPRRHRSPSNTSNLPFPKSAFYSWGRYASSWDEQPPPPVPPLPPLPQNLPCELDTHHLINSVS